MITISLDVTERRAAEEAIRDSETKLQQTREDLFRVSRASAMGQISSAIAHEINQPLTAIRNYVQAARRLLKGEVGGAQSSEVEEFLSKAIEQTDRSAEIIRGLREFIERRDTRRVAENINDVVRSGAELALMGVDRTEVTVHWNLASDLSPVLIDRVQIAQVVINLVRNGLDAMAQSSTKDLTLSTFLDEEGAVRVSVSDCGAGLDEEVKRRLFQPFVTTKSEGMGIGLSISHTIITAHGGILTATENPQGGMVFGFTVPRFNELAKSA